MSDAFECDRCEALQPGRPETQVGTHDPDAAGGYVNIESVGPNMGPRETAVSIMDGDLCEDCAEAFREFWDGGEEA